MQVKEASLYGQAQLAHTPSPVLDTQILLGAVLHCAPAELLGDPTRELTDREQTDFESLITQRGQNIPIAYLTKTKSFADVDLFVDHRVLVPRPETESLVLAARDLIVQHHLHKIYEIGTGSGNITIALARILPEIHVVASDVSPEALEVAHINLEKYDLDNRIQLVQANLVDHIDSADLIIANLPYIPNRFEVMEDILHEPSIAIFGGEDGLELYREMFSSPLFTTFRGFVVIEFGSRQYLDLSRWLANQFTNISISPIKNIDGSTTGLLIEFA